MNKVELKAVRMCILSFATGFDEKLRFTFYIEL